MNNSVQQNCNNMDFIWDNINTCDNNIIKKMSSMLTNEYQEKLNLIYSLLYSNNSIPLKNKTDIINFFYFISPLNNEFLMASYKWNIKIVDNKLFIQNSINKIDSCNILYNKYIDPIKNILTNSGIKFNYFEFKCGRFYKSKDIIWVFEKY